MKITYETYPVLQWMRKPHKCTLTHARTEPRLAVTIAHIQKDPKQWFQHFFNRQVDFLSKPFCQALINSTQAFQKLIQKEGFRIEACAGTILSQSFGTILYTCDEDELECWQLNRNVLMAFSSYSFKEHTLLSVTEPGLADTLRSGIYEKYKATDQEIGSFLTTVVLSYLLMLRYASVNTVSTYPRQAVIDDDTTPEPVKATRRTPGEPAFQNLTDVRINYRTSRWFTTIVCDHDFTVRGHFRLQPKKNDKGETVRELIYINPFTKHGYHRQAQITQQQ